MTNTQRDTLEFGKPSAEREENDLEHYFIENEAFARLRSGPKRILLGNRGSGKSAIFRMLARSDRIAGNIAIMLKPQDYSYQMLSEIGGARLDGNWGKAAAFTAAWKYLILTLALRRVAKIPAAKQRLGKQDRALQRFVRDTRTGKADNPLDLLVDYLERIEEAKSASHNSAHRTAEITRLYDLEELEPLLPFIDSVPGGRGIHVYIDELDLGWDGSEEAQAFVSGLFQACLALNRVDSKLRVYVAIRRELFNSIPALSADSQKYRDLYESLVWDSQTLFELITRRIGHFFPRGNASTVPDDVWHRAFSERSSYRFMLERSLYRPRELIVYCTEALEQARKIKGAIPISQRTVEMVEPKVSRDRLEDIVSEYQFQYPGLEHVLRSFRQSSAVQSRERFLHKLLEISIGDVIGQDKLPYWADRVDPDALMEILWRVGFLLVDVDAREARSYQTPWRVGSPDDPSVDISTAQSLRISPMFYKALAIR